MRIKGLTTLRFFAAFWILLFHLFPNWMPQYFEERSFLTNFVAIGYVSVSFFFLLSGFVLNIGYADSLNESKISPLVFWKRRFFRLYPILIFSLVLGALPLYFGLKKETDTISAVFISLKYFLTNALGLGSWFPNTVRINYPVWSLSVEFFFYLFFPFLCLFFLRNSKLNNIKGIIFFYILSAIIPSLALYLFPPMREVPSNHPEAWRYSSGFLGELWMALEGNPIVHLPTFCCGIILGNLYKRNIFSRFNQSYFLIGALFLAALIILGCEHIPYLLLHTGLAIPVFSLLIIWATGHSKILKILEYRFFILLGEASYCLYMIHVPLRDYFSFIWNKLYPGGVEKNWSFVLLAMFIIIMISIAAYKMIEKPIVEKFK